MSSRIFLYTPWCEQGLSYDAKAIEKIAIENNLEPIITFNKKRKIQWDCTFVPEKKLLEQITEKDILFCFERFPNKILHNVKSKCKAMFLMINYEYYDSSYIDYYKQFDKLYCKSKIAIEGCKNDGLNNYYYMPWILWNHPINEITPIGKKVKVLFNGGTGGYKDRRNFESVVNLLKNYLDDDIEVTIKLTKKIRGWTKKIFKKNIKFLKSDKRVTLIQDNMNKNIYINFLNDFDINLAPSKYEGFGLTILEGLHSRLATLTLDESPMNEIISHNVNGYCMPAVEIEKVRNQPIFSLEESVFLDWFTRIVKDKEKLINMKLMTSKFLEKNIFNFNNHFKKIFHE